MMDSEDNEHEFIVLASKNEKYIVLKEHAMISAKIRDLLQNQPRDDIIKLDNVIDSDDVIIEYIIEYMNYREGEMSCYPTCPTEEDYKIESLISDSRDIKFLSDKSSDELLGLIIATSSEKLDIKGLFEISIAQLGFTIRSWSVDEVKNIFSSS